MAGATGNNNPFTLSNDQNGNITKLPTDSENDTVSWNYDNKLQEAQKGTKSISVKYDPIGNRVWRVSDDGVNTTTRKYIVDISGGLPVILCEIDTSISSLTKSYIYADGRGSIRLITDRLGNPVESYMYDVYGQPRVMWSAGADGNWLTEDVTTYSSSVIGNRFMFTGREWDWNTSLYYYRARDYSPTLGRFLQTDPIGYADSMNLYAYCGNNPVNWIDPYGEMILLGPQELILPRQLFIPRETVIPWDVAIPAPPITGPIPAPPIAIPMGEKCPPRTKDGGALTEPKMPDSTIGKEGGVEIRHNYKGGDHGPPHFHVKGNGPDNKIGQMGKPLDPTKPLTPAQERLVEKYLPQIRKAADQIMRYHRYQNAPPKSVPLYNKYGQYRGA
jgi:RHS repeat-associated protein